jgi:TP901 family phage tail tape measure protein
MAVRDVGNLRTRLSFEDKGATSSLQRFKQDLAGLRSEMRTVTSLGKGYTNSLKGLKQQQDILNRQMRTHQERVKELNRRYQEAVKAKGEDSEEARKLARQYNNAKAEMQRTEQQLKNVTRSIEAQLNPWKQLSRNLDRAGDRFQTVGQRMSDFGRSYTMHVTAPIVAGGTAIFKAAMDFESAFAGVQKTVDASEEELQELRKAIREMAKEIPASAEEIAAVAEAAGQLGIETESIEEFTRTMIDLGEATNLTSEQAATEFARFANIVGMSQKDFDRLGSSVVALGNSMATTESEISSMAMRLAAQGSQVGMTEAQIMALAATMSSLGIQAEMGGTAMTTILKKIQSAVGEGGKSLQGFAKVARVSSDEFAKVWSKDPIKALDMFIKGLAKSGEEGENLSGILADLSIKGVYETDVLMRLAGGADLLSNAVNTSTEAWKENTALTDEASQRYQTTESRMRILWNRIKDVAIQLGDSLAPAIMDALEAAEPFIESIEDGARAFTEMDKEQQRTILQMIAFVAAAGPVSMVLGNITSGIGSFLKFGSSLSDLLGKAKGGTGLLSKIASFGPLGVGGLAIGGITLLATGIFNLTKDMHKLHDISTETADAMMDQYLSNIEMIDSLADLRVKSRLTNHEFERYLDLNSRLGNETNPAVIEEIKDEMARLQEKSGLSNEELSKMVEYNSTLTETIPEATSKITEQGNRVAGTTDELRKYNQELANMAKRELEAELQKSLANELELREQIKEAQIELNKLTEFENGLRDIVKAKQDGSIDSLKEQLLAEQELVEEAYREAVARGEVSQELSNRKSVMERLVALADMDLDVLRQTLGETILLVDEQRELVEKKQADLNKTGEIVAKMVEYELIAAGINEEKAKQAVKDAKVSTLLDEQLQALENQKKELEKQTPPAMRVTDEYKNAKQEIEEQIKKLQTAKGNIETLISEAGEYNEELAKDINKMVKTELNPSASDINKELSKGVDKHVRIYTTKDSTYARIGDPITKQVNIRTAGGRSLAMYAEGTPLGGHKGGPAIVGELGPELARIGNRWSMLDFGIYDLPRGTHVFTHEESKRILGAINRIPAYADGARPVGEANRIVNELNNQQTNTLIPNQPMIIQLVTPDRRVLAEYVVDEITELQRFKEARIRRFADQN